MAIKKDFELPKLPYGQGSYSWKDKEDTQIIYRKTIIFNENRKSETVYAESIKKCNDKMKLKENMLETCYTDNSYRM